MSSIAPVVASVATEVIKDVVKNGFGNKNKRNNTRQKRKPARKQNPRPKPKEKPRRARVQRPTVTRDKAIRPPVALGYKYRGSQVNLKLTTFRRRDAIRIVGTELIGPVTLFAENYREMMSIPLNPLMISESKLSVQAKLYTKFSFKSVRFTYKPSCGTSTSGQALMSHIDDPELPAGKDGSLALLKALSSVKGCTDGPVWSEISHGWNPFLDDRREYYINPDINGENRLTIQAIFKMIQAVAGAAEAQTGMLYMDYDFTLYDSILNTESMAALTAYPAYMGTTATADAFHFVDSGSWSNLLVRPPSTMTIGTIQPFYCNFGIGSMETAKVYYTFRQSADAASYIWDNPTYALTGSTSGRVSGSLFGTTTLPENATCWTGTMPESPASLSDAMVKEFDELKLTNNNTNTTIQQNSVSPLARLKQLR